MVLVLSSLHIILQYYQYAKPNLKIVYNIKLLILFFWLYLLTAARLKSHVNMNLTKFELLAVLQLLTASFEEQ